MKRHIIALALALALAASLGAVCAYAADDGGETGGGFLDSLRDTLNNAGADSDTGQNASGQKTADVQQYILDVGMLVADGVVSYGEWENDPEAAMTRYGISLSMHEDGSGFMKSAADETEITWNKLYIIVEGEKMPWFTDGRGILHLRMDDMFMTFIPAADDGVGAAAGYEMTDPRDYIHTNQFPGYPYSVEIQEMWTETDWLSKDVYVYISCAFTNTSGTELSFSGDAYSLNNDGLMAAATSDYDSQKVAEDAVFVTTLTFQYPKNSNTDFSKMTLTDEYNKKIRLEDVLMSGYAEDTTYDRSPEKKADDFVNKLDDAFHDTLDNVDEYINGGGLEDDLDGLDKWFNSTFGGLFD